MTVHAIVVAAGTGTRFGGEVPKQLVSLRDRPMLAWTLLAFAGAGVERIVVVASAAHAAQTEQVAALHAPGARVVPGGATRSESVGRGVAALEGDAADVVLVHDAARPLVTVDLIAAVISRVEDTGAVTPTLAVTDAMVEDSGGVMGVALDRSTVRRVQTPQGFRLDVITEAHRLAAAAGDTTATDDAALVSRYLGVDVALIPGEEENLKITTASDLAIAAAFLDRRLGAQKSRSMGESSPRNSS